MRSIYDFNRPVAYVGRPSRQDGGRRVILVSGERMITLPVPPWLAMIVAFIIAAMAVILTVAALYSMLRDDLLHATFDARTRQIQGYEDHIAALRSEIDRISSHQILDQMAFDEKIDRLLSAQQALDGRQKIVTDLIARAENNRLLDGGAAGAQPVPTAPLTSPLTGPGTMPGRHLLSPEADPEKNAFAPEAAPPQRRAERVAFAALNPARSPISPQLAQLTTIDPESGRRTVEVNAFATTLKAMNDADTASIRLIAEAADRRADAVISTLAPLGIAPKTPTPDSHPVEPDAGAEGGPYLPPVPETVPETLNDAVVHANGALDHLSFLESYTDRLPLGEPVPGATITSGFGNRPDPFLGTLAFHPGIDFRLPYGSPVPATAAGTITNAAWTGGYGNMVEIDHGNGLSTRYAHLSELAVHLGQHVEKGMIIGLVGSTGRSTGTHLHYETRLNGEPLNPMAYLEAGDRIHALLPD